MNRIVNDSNESVVGFIPTMVAKGVSPLESRLAVVEAKLATLENVSAELPDGRAAEIGNRVLAHGLSKQHLDGQTGTITFVGDLRAGVLLDGAETPMAIKFENLFFVGAGRTPSALHSSYSSSRPESAAHANQHII